jgi:carboxymethylenebutenolidase
MGAPPPSDGAPGGVTRLLRARHSGHFVVARFTHTQVMDWLVPRIAPSGKRVEVAVIAVIQFEGGKIAQEHIYWDQATVLAQLGLLEVSMLPVAGAESARKVLGPMLPANTLIARARQGR